MRVEDVDALTQLWCDPDVTRFMGGPRDYDTLHANLLKDIAEPVQPTFDLWTTVEAATGRIIGHCGIYDKEIEGVTEHEVIYVLARDAWGKGYATEAALAIKEYGFNTLGLARVIALIEPENVASERVARKAGFAFEREVVRPGGAVRKVYAASESSPETITSRLN
jgi:RimJ/RimL family protein N-acetyltransferase